MITELIEAQHKLLTKVSVIETLPESKKLKIDDKALEKGGYPLRHRLRIKEMYGPGLEMAKKHLPKILTGGALIILAGDRGRGKTQVGTWWAAQRTLHNKLPGRYVTTNNLIGDIKATWHQGARNRGSESDLIEQYERTPYLVLDEFHERGASDWEARTLIGLIDHRYYSMKCTVIICNSKPDMITQTINASMIDRANETGGLIYCDWPSYRG